ncbi:MAG: signal peptidase I [Kibdelosporangium sp.]
MYYNIQLPSGWRSVVAVVAIGVGAILIGLSLMLGPPSFDVVAETGMSPTIEEGWSVTARKVGPGQIGRGNIVVFRADAWAAPGQGSVGPVPAMIRRVVGIGGDTVACCDVTGKLMVNGKPVDEDYLPLLDQHPARARMPFAAKVPDGHVFVAGDHRGESVDSRHGLGVAGEGAIPEDRLLGVVGKVNGSSLQQTPAFAQAGLPGEMFDDTTERNWFTSMLAGGIGMLALGLAGLGCLQVRR